MRSKAAIGFVLALALAGPANAQDHGRVEEVRVFGASLAGNLEGNDATRDVAIYLPPSYDTETDRRYPVVYFLHGFGMTSQSMAGFLDLGAAADSAIASGAREMIVVIPDAFTKYSGSMYSSSPTIGDWEGYVADDLVDYVDSNYRTIADRMSRGLSGHSMGGYGAVRIGMKRPDQFTSMYAMSSCCLMNAAPPREVVEQQIANDNTPSQIAFANVMPALAAAWAPNPQNPPHYFDWPYEDGEELPLVAAKWVSNSPLAMVDQYLSSLNMYEAIHLDIGDDDPLLQNNLDLDAALTRLGVEHEFELYEGDHVNRVAARFRDKLLPMFSATLAFD